MGSGPSAEALVQDIKDGSDVQLEAALKTVCDTAGTNEAKREALIKASAIGALVDVLRKKDIREKLKEYAAAALGHLAMCPEAKTEIAEAGGVDSLVKLVKDGTEGCKGAAATALCNLANKCPENQRKIAAAGGINALVSIVRDGEQTAQARCWAAAGLGNLALQHEGNQELVAQAGGVSAVCDLLAKIVPEVPDEEPPSGLFKVCGGCSKRNRPSAAVDASEKAKVLVVRALSSIGYNSEKNQERIAKAGGYTPLVDMVKDDDTQSRMEAISTLVNIVGKSHDNRTKLAQAGVIPVVVNELKHEGTSMNRKAKCTGLLALLSQSHTTNAEAIVAADGIPSIVWQTHTGTDEGKLYAAMAICMLAEAGHEMQSKLGEGGATLGVGKLVEGGNAQQRHWSAKALIALARDHPENKARIEAHGGALPSEAALRGLKAEGLKLTRCDESQQPAQATSPAKNLDTELAGPELPPHLAAQAASEVVDRPSPGEEGPRRRGTANGGDDD